MRRKNNTKKHKGKVIYGNSTGRTLGFPTINIKPEKPIRAKEGVYACKVIVEDNELYGILHYGTSPTFKREDKIIEVFIFDYDNDLYNKEAEVEFYNFIRGTKKFNSKEELVSQITKDVLQVRKIFKERGNF